MSALIRMRLAAYVRTQVAFAPLLAALVVLGIFYGGGQARPGEAYGVSAVVLFPVLAWQAKILLDVEPDVQRAIAVTALGSRTREIVAGLAAAAVTALPAILLAMVAPWVLNAILMPASTRALGIAVLSGLWVHVVAVPPAVALGALASRALVRSAGNGAAVLVCGFVLAIVLGLKNSPVPWLMPPLMPAARAMFTELPLTTAVGLSAWALAWTAVLLTLYVRWRRTTRP